METRVLAVPKPDETIERQAGWHTTQIAGQQGNPGARVAPVIDALPVEMGSQNPRGEVASDRSSMGATETVRLAPDHAAGASTECAFDDARSPAFRTPESVEFIPFHTLG